MQHRAGADGCPALPHCCEAPHWSLSVHPTAGGGRCSQRPAVHVAPASGAGQAAGGPQLQPWPGTLQVGATGQFTGCLAGKVLGAGQAARASCMKFAHLHFSWRDIGRGRLGTITALFALHKHFQVEGKLSGAVQDTQACAQSAC